MFSLIENNEHLVVIDKWPGASFHSENNEAGLFEAVKKQLVLSELYPVHRLDKVTSGLLVFAKSRVMAQQLGEQFEQHRIEKYYLAISNKAPKKKQGLIKGDMQPSRRGSYKLMQSQNNPAITQFFSTSIGNGLRAYLLKPHTGKTHQLRVAMKSLGSPICGDARYAANTEYDRVYLHAYRMLLEVNGQQTYYQCLPTQGDLFINPALLTLLNNEWKQPERLPWPHIKR